MAKAKSINFPFIPLEKAVSRIIEVYDKEGRNPVAPNIAAEHWGYSSKSSGARQTIAALRAFGLIELVKGNIQISEPALNNIILDKRPNSEERDNTLKEAAIKPKIFSEMWKKWGQGGLPSDANMAYFLTIEKGVKEDSASRIINIFRKTISFTNLTYQPITEDNKTEGDISEGTINEELQTNTQTEQEVGIRRDVCSLDEGQAIIQFPEEMGKGSYSDLLAWLEVIKSKVTRLSQEEEEKRKEELL